MRRLLRRPVKRELRPPSASCDRRPSFGSKSAFGRAQLARVTQSKIWLWGLLVVGACRSAAGGGAAPGPASAARPAPPADPGVTLGALAARYWNAHLEAHPLEATEIGDRRFDDRLPDLTPAARDRELARLGGLRAEVEALPAAALSDGDRVTRALLLREIDADLADGICRLDDWAVDARDGLQVAFLRLPELQPVRTVAEGRTAVARWQKMGPTIDQETANLRRGLAAGKVATAEEVKPTGPPPSGWRSRPRSTPPSPAARARRSRASATRCGRRSCRARATRPTPGSPTSRAGRPATHA